MGCCVNPDCRQWTIFARLEGRWVVTERFFYPTAADVAAVVAG